MLILGTYRELHRISDMFMFDRCSARKLVLILSKSISIEIVR